jgi:DNA repair protein RadC
VRTSGTQSYTAFVGLHKAIFTQKLIDLNGLIEPSCRCSRKEVQFTIKANTSCIIIFHNHPSGNIQPGESDISIARKIKESGILMDIQLLDHLIIVPEGNYYSIGDEVIV